jgi:hypothetical protein
VLARQRKPFRAYTRFTEDFAVVVKAYKRRVDAGKCSVIEVVPANKITEVEEGGETLDDLGRK